MQRMEFYVIDDEVWCRLADGSNIIVDEHNIDIINDIFERIKERYKEAYDALSELFGKSSRNITFFKYRIVKQFIKCNFSRLDTTSSDIDAA